MSAASSYEEIKLLMSELQRIQDDNKKPHEPLVNLDCPLIFLD